MNPLYNWPEETREFKEKVITLYRECGRLGLGSLFKDVFHKKTGEPVSPFRVYWHYFKEGWFKDIHRILPVFSKATPDFKETLIQAYKSNGEQGLMYLFKDFKHQYSGKPVTFAEVVRKYPFLKSEFPDMISIHKESLRKYKWPKVTPELEKRLIEHYVTVGIMGLHFLVPEACAGHSMSDYEKDFKTYTYYSRWIKFPYKNNRSMDFSQRGYPLMTPHLLKSIQSHFMVNGRLGISGLLGLPVSKANDVRIYNYLLRKRLLPKAPRRRRKSEFIWPEVTPEFKEKVRELYLQKGRAAAMRFLGNIEFHDGRKASYSCMYEHYKRLGIIPLRSFV